MESRYIIRRAEITDIPHLTGLLAALFSIEIDFKADASKQRKGLEMMFDDMETRCILVAEHDKRVIGMCTAQILISTAEGGSAALIEDVVVDGSYRRLGIGKKLLSGIESWARGKGVKRFQLSADRNNAPALEFYKSMSWNITNLICLHKRY